MKTLEKNTKKSLNIFGKWVAGPVTGVQDEGLEVFTSFHVRKSEIILSVFFFCPDFEEKKRGRLCQPPSIAPSLFFLVSP